METALFWMVAILLVTQIVRVIQNAIQLRRQTKVIRKQLDGITDITNEDIERQREAYTLVVEYLKEKMEGTE